MKTTRWIVLALLALSSPLSGQTRGQFSDQQASRLLVTRAELLEALERHQNILVDPPGRRARHRSEQALVQIQERLDHGDFRAGDRIFLRIEGIEMASDSVVVEAGPLIYLPNMGEISLHGVLRSELEDYLSREVGRFVREPNVFARGLIRLTMEGGVAAPGYYTFPADLPLGEAVMAAGGPVQNAVMDKIEVKRGEETFLDRDEYQIAIASGSSLDQLNLRAGDGVDVPVSTTDWLPQIVRWGVALASFVLIGTRIY